MELKNIFLLCSGGLPRQMFK